MKVSRLLMGIILCGLLISACSPQNYLDSRAKAIKRAVDGSEELEDECFKYLEYFQEGDRVDLPAVEKCMDSISPNNGSARLKFCKIFYDAGGEISPSIYDDCLAAAKRDVVGMFDYDRAREQFLDSVKSSIPFIRSDDAQAVADEIYSGKYVKEAQSIIWNMIGANEECEDASSAGSEFWEFVAKMKLGSTLDEDVNQVIESTISQIDARIAEGNYACTASIIKNLASIINESPDPSAFSPRMEPKLKNWLETSRNLSKFDKNLDTIYLLTSIREFTQMPEDAKTIDTEISELITKEALTKREPVRISEIAGFVCSPEEKVENVIYHDVRKQVIESEQDVEGKFLNCTLADLPEELLATSIAEIKYLVQATRNNSFIEKTCEYNGGYKLDLYSGVYEVEVVDIDTDKIVAETTVKSRPAGECELFMTFISKRDGHYLPPDSTEISTWLTSLQLSQ